MRVNGIAPGYVPTKFSAALVQSPELRQAQARPHRCLCICLQSAALLSTWSVESGRQM